MLNAIFISTALIVALALLSWHRRRTASQTAHTALRALDDCALLLRLVRTLQQHRGMSVAWLAGDASFAPQMRQRQLEIDRCIATLDGTVRAEEAMPRACLTHNELMVFRFQWRELIEQLGNGGLLPEQSLSRHGQLVSRALEWLDALGESRVELGAAGRVDAGRVRNHVASLPALAEYLGQARAIGTGVASRGQCAPVARVRLMFLAARIDALVRQALAAADGSRAAIEAGRNVGSMMTTLRRNLLGETGGITAQAWFAEATRAIDSVYAWVDECGVELRRELQAPTALLQPAMAAH